jgi:hypothetical protein
MVRLANEYRTHNIALGLIAPSIAAHLYIAARLVPVLEQISTHSPFWEPIASRQSASLASALRNWALINPST